MPPSPPFPLPTFNYLAYFTALQLHRPQDPSGQLLRNALQTPLRQTAALVFLTHLSQPEAAAYSAVRVDAEGTYPSNPQCLASISAPFLRAVT